MLGYRHYYKTKGVNSLTVLERKHCHYLPLLSYPFILPLHPPQEYKTLLFPHHWILSVEMTALSCQQVSE